MSRCTTSVNTTTLGKLVEKFAAGVVDTSGNFPPLSLTPVANLSPVSLITVVHLAIANISANFRKNSKRSYWGKTDSWKKPEAKIP
jgi:hypothetical protein